MISYISYREVILTQIIHYLVEVSLNVVLHQNIMFVPLAHVGLVVASLPCLGCCCCLCKAGVFVGPGSCYALEPRLESRLYALIWKYKYLLFYYSFDCCLSHWFTQPAYNSVSLSFIKTGAANS